MKLIYCTECQDVIKLSKWVRYCKCGESGGCYKSDGINAEIWGNAIPIGFDNGSLKNAIENQPVDGDGVYFTAFVIPKKCATVKRS